MSLKEYHKKRNFSSTSEPKGSKKSQKANRFVIQYHEARAKHYDLRLEHKGVLLSWAVPKGLSTNPKDKHLAVMVEDHPIDYINFEGVIPKGNYGAGTVEIFDEGNFLPLEDFDKGLKKGHLKFLLNGEKLKGGWSLVRIKDNNWLVVKSDDEFAKEEKTKASKLPFQVCSPQLATLSQKIPKGKDWIYEIKYDGYRILSYKDNKSVKMLSRNNLDFTKKFSSLSKAIAQIQKDNFVIDGEVVIFDENGRTDFGLLQQSVKKNKNNFYYIVFDLLALDGEDLRMLPLSERKAKLERLLFKAPPCIIFSSHVDKGEESFKFAKENNLEGIVAKKLSSPYSGSRNEDWLKIKCYQRQEYVIGGYTTSDKNDVLSAILVGYYDNGELVYIGKVGTGFSEANKKQLRLIFEKIARKTSPFAQKIKEKGVFWLKPELVAEIQYMELTKDNLLRQPSFIGLREDKKAEEVLLEFKR